MAPFKSTELKSDWRSDFLIEETDCDCEGCGQDPCIKCGESHHNINEEVQGGVSVETYTKDTKFTEIETVDIIKAKPLVNEGKTSRYRGFDVGGSGHKDSMNRGTDEKIIHNVTGVNYNLMVNKGKKTVDPKKNEVIAASYEIGKIQLPKINREETESQQSLVEEVFVEDYMTDLYNEGYSVDEINEYLLEEYEIDEEYLEEAWGKVLKGLGQIAGKALKSGAETVVKRAVKDTGKTVQAAKKVSKFVTNPKNLARANQDTQKVIDTGTAIVKGGKEAMARTYAAGYKTGQLLRKPAQLPGVKTFKQLASDIKKVNKQGNISVMRSQIKGETGLGVADQFKKGYSKRITDANTKFVNRQSKGKTTTATATKPEPKVTTVKSPAKSPAKPEPKVTTVTKKVDKRKGKLGDAWSQFPKKKNKQLGLPKKPVDRTNKLLPVTKSSAGALPAGNTKGLLPAGKKGGPISKAQSTSVVSSPGGKVVQSKGGKLTKEVTPNERKLSVVDKLNKAKRGEKGKGTTYTSKGVRQLPPSDDPTKTKVAAASLGLGSYGGYEFSKKVGLIGKKEKKEVKEAIALAVPAGIGLGKTALKVGGAVLAAKGGSELLKKLLGSKKKPVKTDWDTNPQDDIDRELNVKQGQAKDRAKYKNFDKKVRTAKRAKDAGNISDDKYKELMSDAAKSRPKANESFSDWRSEINL